MNHFNKSQSTGISPGIFERNTADLIVLGLIVTALYWGLRMLVR